MEDENLTHQFNNYYYRAVGSIFWVVRPSLEKEKKAGGLGGAALQKLEGVFIFTLISWHLY